MLSVFHTHLLNLSYTCDVWCGKRKKKSRKKWSRHWCRFHCIYIQCLSRFLGKTQNFGRDKWRNIFAFFFFPSHISLNWCVIFILFISRFFHFGLRSELKQLLQPKWKNRRQRARIPNGFIELKKKWKIHPSIWRHRLTSHIVDHVVIYKSIWAQTKSTSISKWWYFKKKTIAWCSNEWFY